MDWFIERAKEPSTLRGVLALAGVLGVNVAPELSSSIIGTLVSVAGLIEVIRKER